MSREYKQAIFPLNFLSIHTKVIKVFIHARCKLVNVPQK